MTRPKDPRSNTISTPGRINHCRPRIMYGHDNQQDTEPFKPHVNPTQTAPPPTPPKVMITIRLPPEARSKLNNIVWCFKKQHGIRNYSLNVMVSEILMDFMEYYNEDGTPHTSCRPEPKPEPEA